jgi:hypothetical protein
MSPQFGQLEPTSDWVSPFTVVGMYGRGAPNPLVMTNHQSGLEAGADYNVVQPLSGVQTYDDPHAHGSPQSHSPFGNRNVGDLFKPMHSEGFWIALLLLAALGIFSGQVKLGPLRAELGR